MEASAHKEHEAKAVEARILDVDDEVGIREGCRKVLEFEGYAVEVAEDGLQGCTMVTRKEDPFDLALVESTRPDGTREFFYRKGVSYSALTPAYSDDGGHLNNEGRRHVAERLLVFLCDLRS